MSDNDSWTPEEIARANERQKEINEKKERENKLLEERKIKEALKSNSYYKETLKSKSYYKNYAPQGVQKQGLVKTYKGSQEKATELFRIDAAKMSTQGYFPTSQSWAPGTYGCGSFLMALLLCFLIVGILIFIYMLLVKPEGTLSVTYELRVDATESKPLYIPEEKTCPKCAEQVKIAAQICRFCGHNFV